MKERDDGPTANREQGGNVGTEVDASSRNNPGGRSPGVPAYPDAAAVLKVVEDHYDLMLAIDTACVEWGSLDSPDMPEADEIYFSDDNIGLYWRGYNAEARDRAAECPVAFLVADEAGRRAMVEAAGREYKTRQQMFDSLWSLDEELPF